MKKQKITVAGFGFERADAIEKSGGKMTAIHYRTALNRFVRDVGNIPLEKLSHLHIDGWITAMRTEGLHVNTINFYICQIRAIYNRANFEEVFEMKADPFKKIQVKIEATPKRALSKEMMKSLIELELPEHMQVYRDVFLLSFQLRGMAPVDIWKMKRSDINDEVLHYKRSKTKRALSIRIEKETEATMKRIGWMPGNNPCLNLPVYDRVNYNLKKIGEIMKLPFKLTLYCARHTWATTAQRIHAPISIISQAMGHSDEATTRIYLAGIETPVIDEWNRNVIKSIFRSEK